MAKTVIVRGKLLDGLSDTIRSPMEVLIEDAAIVEVTSSVGRPNGAKVLDLSDRTLSPVFIDTHVHLFVDCGATASPWRIRMDGNIRCADV